MWPAIAFVLLAACIAIHHFWSRRLAGAQASYLDLRNELNALKDIRAHDVAESRLHQFAILNSVVEGVLVLDAEGRIQTLNKSLEKLFALEHDVRGLTLLEAFRSHELAHLARQLESEERVEEFALNVATPPEPRYVEVNAARIGGAKRGGIVMVFHDITRITALENVRREFVANVSHELRTPLTLIKGCIETLLDGAKDNPDAALRFLRVIERHTARLTFLIEDLLTLSHLESGKTTIQRTNRPLGPIVERVLEELAQTAAARQVRLQNEIPPGLEANIDAERIEQVFFNLIDNAIKYGRTAGSVRIFATQEPGAVRVAVEDDGPGIPPESRERVFERFYRLDRARSRESGGTGLGLAIVKHIIQAHGGKVWVESETDGGSNFFFTVPS